MISTFVIIFYEINIKINKVENLRAHKTRFKTFMTSLIIPIIQKNKISAFFIKSSRYLLNKYNHYFRDTEDYNLKLQMFVDCWNKEFSSELLIIDQTPASIRFSNTSSMTLFFLRFGN